MKLISK